MATSGPVRTAIVSVGNELLYGQTVDTNAAWLGRSLSERGFTVVRRFTVGDLDADIADAVGQAAPSADLVVVSGGLGPTRDDRTRGSVANLVGAALVEDPATRDAVERRYREAGRVAMTDSVVHQALIPEGAIALANPEGTAPGIAIDWNGVLLILLPGVPSELRAIVTGELGALLDRRFGARLRRHRVHHRTVHTVGIPESTLAVRLEARLQTLDESTAAGIDIAYLPDRLGVDLRFSLRGDDVDDVTARLDALVRALDGVLAPWTVHAPDGDLAAALVEVLVDAGMTLAVAESCTGGWVAKRLTDRAGASIAILGGIVAYSNDAKITHLGVSAEDLAREGAVSEVVACQLAQGAVVRFGADTGIGVTGIAGPGGGSEEKPVGTVWIATSLDREVVAHRHRFPGDRTAVREAATQAALEQLYRRIADRPREG